jgi:GntR family transcriptional regulator
MDLLVADGVLTRSQGEGTVVRRPRFDSSLFRFFRFKSASGEDVRPTARILRRSLEVPDEALRQALQAEPRSKVIHLTRQRLVEGKAVLAEEIWLPRDGFEALATLALDDFGDLLYPLYERLCKQVVATARETLRVEAADKSIAATLGIKPGHPVIRVDRVASNFAGKPVECRSTVGAADGFRYEIEIR